MYDSQVETPHNKVLGIKNDFVYPSNSKIYGNEPQYITKPCCSEQILPVPWHFIILRFHCRNVAFLTEF